ncbi:MAG: carbamoyltransferase HypF, partial [Ignavibacteriales bacterium]|nr:carbamoyltransferase HypF [Ignavibacteriales bacterium]
EVEGERIRLDAFLDRLTSEKPPRSFFQSIESRYLDPAGYSHFEIRESTATGDTTALVLPDIATCEDCLQEIFDPRNRRYHYPFTNCTNCGPRYSIITQLPYDRPNTSMSGFHMCPECQKEYEDPMDRRFHAQPNACPLCGPQVVLWDEQKQVLAECSAAVETAAAAILEGRIVAVKGIGGFLLMTNAQNDAAVQRLRRRKLREEKPFALMYPSMEAVRMDCSVSDGEERLLRSPEAPLVLLRRNRSMIAQSVAPRNPSFAVMLPYSPLHHLLMKTIGTPVVATSGNRSDEPMCIDEHEAVERLAGIADLYLVHNRQIVRVLDDSIVRVMGGREMMMRRARGFAPLPVTLSHNTAEPILAVGAHLKNTIALSKGNDVFISQHLGDLETQESFEAFRAAQRDMRALYKVEPKYAVCDLHPDYVSTKEAKAQKIEVIEIQHHYAHIASCMAENQLDAPVLGVAWDGTGYGTDGTIWGGEFLHVTKDSWRMYGDEAFTGGVRQFLGSFDAAETDLLRQMMAKNINTPVTTSAGRLFDAAATMLGIQTISRFEGQAAMELEFLTDDAGVEESYPFTAETLDGRMILDWSPMIQEMMNDIREDSGTIRAASCILRKLWASRVLRLAADVFRVPI